jgi:hypothetical protein
MPSHPSRRSAARAALPALLLLVLSACASVPRQAPAPVVQRPPSATPAPRPKPPACADCARVERIEKVAAIRATPSGRAVLGGVVGGVVSAPAPSRTAAAPAAPVKARPAQAAWRIGLRMDDGRRMVLHQNLLAAGVAVGSRVRLVQGRIVPLK